MNAKKFQMTLIVTLVALFANTALVFAHPAEAPEVTPARAPLTNPCAAVLAQADQLVAQIDIPSRRAEYARLDKLGRCQVIAAASIAIPVTATTPDLGRQRYENFKMRQAERMSH